MKRLHLVLALSVLFSSIITAPVLAVAEDVAAKAVAVISEMTFDFGTVPQGTKVVHDFAMKNAGGMDLIIQRLVPGCGCTAATANSEPIKPGAEGKIHVEFDTTGFRGDKLKTVRVYTNDADNPSQVLTVRGVVQPDVSIEPMSVSFDEVIRGEITNVPSKTVEVRVREGSSVKIAGLKSFSKNLVVTELEGSETLKRFSISIDPQAPVGEIRDRVIVNISGGRESSINIPVFAQVKGQLVLEPSQISFGIVEGNNKLSRSVKFNNRGTEPVIIKEVKSSDPAVSASYKVIVAGKKYVIQVTVDPQKVQRDLRASVEIVTDNNKEENVILSIYGILPPKVAKAPKN